MCTCCVGNLGTPSYPNAHAFKVKGKAQQHGGGHDDELEGDPLWHSLDILVAKEEDEADAAHDHGWPVYGRQGSDDAIHLWWLPQQNTHTGMGLVRELHHFVVPEVKDRSGTHLHKEDIVFLKGQA